MRANKRMISQSLALVSGKGGSGKTIIALSMCKILSETGLKVLLVDCDTSTHGATYFYESELMNHDKDILTINDFASIDISNSVPFKTMQGFDFIPSILNPVENVNRDYVNREYFFEKLDNMFDFFIKNYNIVIFDCQAGFSIVTEWVISICHKNLFILEADAVSSAALRTLYLQLANYISVSNTWQVFNKLTEDERPIYEKVTGTTIFNNLPPIPFDWKVRASFALCQIPSVTTVESAFGLGVLRIMKTIWPKVSDKLNELENNTVGIWYENISSILRNLEEKKESIQYEGIEYERKKRIGMSQIIGFFIVYLAAGISIMSILELSSRYLLFVSCILIAFVGIIWPLYIRKSVAKERQQDKQQQIICEIDAEIERYRTLISTDARLKEYSKDKIE